MVVIRGVGGGSPVRPGRGGRGGPGGFALGGAGEAQGAGAASAVVAPAAVGLLALQEGAPAADRDARGARRAQALLRELAGLQADLLAGRLEASRLGTLAALADGETPADPALAAALAAIALRARIELARLSHERSSSRD
ncbi:flagellar assembly protein FliX [Roseomonas sp. JC162]|uniref:Flagellar assembly protein FliX n=1 Tax=Neoroseomonas marina TaxID=1232220 RepID=A0A848EB50_9PROT|nr:flagellar assembly protein FliX [Neoroseomonas marina]NMJ41731.1 flagellar assembly protein FliX [Neoroseomonas marina]